MDMQYFRDELDERINDLEDHIRILERKLAKLREKREELENVEFIDRRKK